MSEIIKQNSLDEPENRLYKIIHEIKNMHKLSQETIEEIKIMSCEEKMKIIEVYNEMLSYINEFM